MDSFHQCLDIPESAWESLSGEDDVTTATWQWYLENHPAPSWIHIAEALYRQGRVNMQYHIQLERLKSQIPSINSESLCVATPLL